MPVRSNPASLAIQITVICHGYELKCRKYLPLLLPFFEFTETHKSLPDHINYELIPDPSVCPVEI